MIDEDEVNQILAYENSATQRRQDEYEIESKSWIMHAY
jgi:hypothetical protein